MKSRYTLKIESRAAKDLKSLDIRTQKRIIKKIKFYLSSDDPLTYSKKLADSQDGDYRWRIGNFRAVFDVQKNTLKLLRVQHRREIYKK